MSTPPTSRSWRWSLASVSSTNSHGVSAGCNFSVSGGGKITPPPAHAASTSSPSSMPSGVVEEENDGSLASRAGLARERRQQRLENGPPPLRDAFLNIPDRLFRLGRDESVDVEQFDPPPPSPLPSSPPSPSPPPPQRNDGQARSALAHRRPNAPRNRLQAKAMILDREESTYRPGCFSAFSTKASASFILHASLHMGSSISDFSGAAPGSTSRAPSTPPSRAAGKPSLGRVPSPSRPRSSGSSICRRHWAAPANAHEACPAIRV